MRTYPNATEAYLAHVASNPDPREPGAREYADGLRRAHLTASGQEVADLEAIKAKCGGFWHPAWEARLQSAVARHEATRVAVVEKASLYLAAA